MNREKIEAVKLEIARISKRIKALESGASCSDYVTNDGRVFLYESGKHTAAVRRASLDLTRALADLRKRAR